MTPDAARSKVEKELLKQADYFALAGDVSTENDFRRAARSLMNRPKGRPARPDPMRLRAVAAKLSGNEKLSLWQACWAVAVALPRQNCKRHSLAEWLFENYPLWKSLSGKVFPDKDRMANESNKSESEQPNNAQFFKAKS